MKWIGNRESKNVEDRRGVSRFRSMAIGAAVVVNSMLASWALVTDPLPLAGHGVAPATAPASGQAGDAGMTRFVSTVLADTEDTWSDLFTRDGRYYVQPHLVLFRDTAQTACGMGKAAMGPFYCQADQKVYIDLGFYETLKNRLGAPGDFAQAYVIAHEVGHHVQKLMGISAKVAQMRVGASRAENNALSVRLELQADCFAGAWAYNSNKSRQTLEQGDIEEAMNAAARIGDDALQRARGAAVVPENFTHGTSAQRQRWFGVGLKSGSIKDCDTLDALL